MSGIGGILNRDGLPVDCVLLEKMTRFMSFRGPDRQEWWTDGAIGLGHALLRTTVESKTERQPFSLDGHIWITGDVRLDGRSELIEKLRTQGQIVRPNAPDVELLLQAYAAWQTRCVEYLIGDFVFAIWDARARQLFCARDQFGVAPLYYAHVNDALVFSNTLACIRLHPGVSDELNEQAIADWLLYRTNQDPTTTTFRAIQRVPPAHTLTWAGGILRCQRYWALPEQTEIQYRPRAEIVARFQQLFTQAVQDRLRTDRIVVPLSGGLDSGSVGVTAQRLLANTRENNILHAYTITVDHIMPDREREYAKLVAAHAEIPLQLVPYTLPNAPDITNSRYLAPEPGLIPSLAQQEILTEAEGGGRVMLSGLGGDPLLFPSRRFLFDLVKRGQWGKLARVMGQQWQTHRSLPPLYLRSSLMRRSARPVPAFPRWLNPSLAARLDLPSQWLQTGAKMESQDPRRGMAEAPYWSNVFSFCDPGYSARPIKARFPFFDLRLLSFASTLPPVPWFVRKTLLREAMRGALPEAVRQRPKTPLGSDPIYRNSQITPQAWMGELAMTPELEPFVKREVLLDIVNAPLRATQAEFQGAYSALALAYWLKRQHNIRLS